ncbi:glycosyltransferase [Maribacter litoralis]|uniref:glycosyltransferase n=1 Tax=Maribacter litoralis TaxID=2059726 RepID=UPI003F5CDF41
MKILHLNSYYIDNHLYAQLFTVLNADVEQRVYIPIKMDREPENEVKLNQLELVFEKIIKPFHKYNYFGKIRKLFHSIRLKRFYEDVNYIHAHNLFTDGALAYKLKKKYNINYIVAVRTTDIGLQYRLMWHRRFLIHRVLKNADCVVFISNTYRDKLFAMMPKSIIEEIKHKVQVIPNGIDDLWLTNLKKPIAKPLKKEVKLLYVGQIIKRKNLLLLIDAIQQLNKKTKHNFTLTIVGPENSSEAEYYKQFLELTNTLPWIDYKGKIKAGETLLHVYRDCDIFVMPSKNELFGLVYIEALSQGKPVLYASGEGIDGYLKNYDVGQAVDPDDSANIAEGINTIVNNYKNYTDFDDVVLPFNWNNIAKVYKKLYVRNE